MKRVRYLLYSVLVFMVISLSAVAHAGSYELFRALNLNSSYDTVCEMLGKPTFVTGESHMWSINGDTLICGFEKGKLYAKVFNTNKIVLRVPITIDQYNSIQQRDSYDVVKAKLNNQDGYLSGQGIFPIFGLQEWYTWMNPDGVGAEIQFMMGMVANKSIKRVEITEPSVTGSDGRNEAGSGSMDSLFVGKWKEAKPKSINTLTISKADPQTGGYHVELFFYRLADVKGHANIEGNTLSVYVNDGMRLRGTLVKANNRIRFTITESDFGYLKPGGVYEYE